MGEYNIVILSLISIEILFEILKCVMHLPQFSPVRGNNSNTFVQQFFQYFIWNKFFLIWHIYPCTQSCYQLAYSFCAHCACVCVTNHLTYHCVTKGKGILKMTLSSHLEAFVK